MVRTPDDPNRLHEGNAEYRSCKLGTHSAAVWIYTEDLPLAKGDVIRYAERERGKTKRGRVIADPDRRYLFISRDETADLFDS